MRLPVDEHDSAATYFRMSSHAPSQCATPTSGRHVHQQNSSPTSMETVMKAALGSLSLLVLSSSLFFAQVQPVPDRRPLAFTHVTVIDATGSPAQPDMTVVVSGDRISGVGKFGTVAIPPSPQGMEARVRFMIPVL